MLHEDGLVEIERDAAGAEIARRGGAGETHEFAAQMVPAENARCRAAFVQADAA
jgi:hypothetical protein